MFTPCKNPCLHCPSFWWTLRFWFPSKQLHNPMSTCRQSQHSQTLQLIKGFTIIMMHERVHCQYLKILWPGRRASWKEIEVWDWQHFLSSNSHTRSTERHAWYIGVANNYIWADNKNSPSAQPNSGIIIVWLYKSWI